MSSAKYKIHMVSFQSLENPNSYATLMVGRGEQIRNWQYNLLCDYVEANQTSPAPPDDGSDLV